MSQCYWVKTSVGVRDAERLVALTNEYINANRFGKGAFDRSDLTTPLGCVRAILAGDNQPDCWEGDADGERLACSNSFEATYSWETVLGEWFKAVAPSLADGSEIEVYPDEGKWILRVEDGKAVDVSPQTYTIDELKGLDLDAYDYALNCLEMEAQFEGEGIDPDNAERDLVAFANRGAFRFLDNGGIMPRG